MHCRVLVLAPRRPHRCGLGGVYSIATVIDDFIDRIMVDPRLNANHAGESQAALS